MKDRKIKINLSELTCSQLADILEAEPSINPPESKHLTEMRSRLRDYPDVIKKLRMLGSSPARYWRSSLRSVEVLSAAPTIKLVIGGGMPSRAQMPRWSKRAKQIAAENGTTLHKWGSGAFILHKA